MHGGINLQPAAAGQRREQKVDLRIMAQGFIVPHALHRRLNGLPVEHAAVRKGRLDAEAVLQLAGQHLQIHVPHGVHPDLPLCLNIFRLDQGFLFLQHLHAVQRVVDVCSRRKHQAAGIAWAHHPGGRAAVGSQPVARHSDGQPGNAADLPGRRLRYGGIPCAGIQADFRRLFRPGFPVRAPDRQHVPRLQHTAGDLHEHQARVPRVAGHLVHPGAELRGILFPQVQRGQEIQQLRHALIPQRRAGKARKQPPGGNQGMDHAVRNLSFPQEHVQAALIAQGDPLRIGIRKRNHRVRQLPPQRGQQLLPAAPELIGFVEKENDRHTVFPQDIPQGAGVRLHAFRRADHQHGGVHHADGALRLPGKVRVPGGVNQSDIGFFPGQAGFLGEDRDAAFLLHLPGIQPCIPVVDPALPAYGAGKIQHGFGQGGLAGVHMGRQADDQLLRHPGIPLCQSFCRIISAPCFRTSFSTSSRAIITVTAVPSSVCSSVITRPMPRISARMP